MKIEQQGSNDEEMNIYIRVRFMKKAENIYFYSCQHIVYILYMCNLKYVLQPSAIYGKLERQQRPSELSVHFVRPFWANVSLSHNRFLPVNIFCRYYV